MIYACDHCRFVFSRAGEVNACPDCGKPSVREATTEEKDEYNRNRIERDNSEKGEKNE